MNETLQELLQARAEAVDAQAAIVEAAEAEGRELTSEEETQFDAYEQQIQDLDKKIEAKEKHEQRVSAVRSRQQQLAQPTNHAPRPYALYGANVQQPQIDDGGFKNVGEFFDALRFGDPKGRLQALAQNPTNSGGIQLPEAFRAQVMPTVRNEWAVGSGEDGGFALPAEVRRDEILMFRPEDEIVSPRAMFIPAGDPPDAPVTMPALQQGSLGVFGGVEFSWLDEGGDKPETDANLRDVTWTPKEVAGHTVISDKTLRNWAAASTFIGNLFRGAMMGLRDYVFLRGDGVGKPQGVIDDAAAIKVNRATASSVTFDDIGDMVAAMAPEMLSGAIWVASQSLMSEIVTLKDDAGNSIFIRGDVTRGIENTLLGIPIRFTGRVPAKGTKGDLGLYNFGAYVWKDGSGPFIDASPHVHFKQNKTVIKIYYNFDGRSWAVEPLTLEDGTTKVSPFVVLDVPAQ